MQLNGLHILLTYQCNYECDHCFIWGSPWQTGTFTLAQISEVLRQAKETGTIEWIYFEGGEPFLYYAVLLKAVEEASWMGFKVGIVSNGYWATTVEDACEWLTPLVGVVHDLSVSSDLFHYDEVLSLQAQNAQAAARQLGIPLGLISIAQPESEQAAASSGQLPIGQSSVMYRGRAARSLVDRAGRAPWESFDTCPFEDLVNPGRLHLDPLGNLHICQGICIGNLFETPLDEICRRYDPETHPVTGPLLAGGPAELVRRYDLPHLASYADACHLCDSSRRLLRERFPLELAPDQAYGVGL